MVATAILDIWIFPIVDHDELHGRVIPLFLECLRVGNPFLELFWILGRNQGQTRSQMLR